jgi:hypothetical protein
MENIGVMPVKVGIKLNEIQEIRKNLKDPKIEDDVRREVINLRL